MLQFIRENKKSNARLASVSDAIRAFGGKRNACFLWYVAPLLCVLVSPSIGARWTIHSPCHVFFRGRFLTTHPTLSGARASPRLLTCHSTNLSVVRLSVVHLSVVRLSVVRLSVVRLSVVRRFEAQRRFDLFITTCVAVLRRLVLLLAVALFDGNCATSSVG